MQENLTKRKKSCINVLTYENVRYTIILRKRKEVIKLNWILLEAKTKECGLTNEDVAKALAIDPATYYRKKRGETDFYRREIRIIRKLLGLSSEDVDIIFFND